jgi:hypothetical protein
VVLILPENNTYGTIRAKEGAYEMNFNFIKRKFDIKMVVTFYGLASLLRRMSILLLSIKFSGSIDLVNDQLTATDAIRNTYKQIPFETELKMKGI